MAYADFVTALMALFIVMWLMGASQQVKQAVSGYFRDPRGYTSTLGAGPANSGEGLRIQATSASDVRRQLDQALRQAPEWSRMREQVQVSITGEGLRIDLLETEQGMFFVTGQAGPTAAGERLLKLLGAEIGKLPNSVVVEGHTDARPFRNDSAQGVYGNWELSTDRANMARRLLLESGVRQQQIVEVRGFADARPLIPQDPNDTKNRRVSLVVRFDGQTG